VVSAPREGSGSEQEHRNSVHPSCVVWATHSLVAPLTAACNAACACDAVTLPGSSDASTTLEDRRCNVSVSD